MTAKLFVERQFDAAGTAVVCRFYIPEPQATGEFRCNWTIDWGEGDKKRSAHGIDGVQALLLAMKVAHTELVESDSYKAGRLTYLEGPILDLPGPFNFDEPSQT
ncbi:MAG: hypothetical protein WA940_15635 [Sphingopyxis sp.]